MDNQETPSPFHEPSRLEQPQHHPAEPLEPVPPPQPLNSPQPILPAASHNSGGIILLQWLTYALWGWTIVAMSFLVSFVLAYYINDSHDGSAAPYSIAAVLVLLPMAAISDFFYRRQEPEKKTGMASVVMVIHAVIFALLGIGSLIASVFSLISILIGNSSSKDWQVALASSFIIFILYLAGFLRILNPSKLPDLRRYFAIFMIVGGGVFMLVGIIGPVFNAHKTRNDTLIENNLPTVESDVSNYAYTNNRLPSNLNQVTYDDNDAQTLVNDNLVTYYPNSKPALLSKYTPGVASTYTYYYELCVTYTEANNSYPAATPLSNASSYVSYINTIPHPAGRVCYKVETD